MNQVEEVKKLTEEKMGWPIESLDWIDEAYLANNFVDVSEGKPRGALDDKALDLPDVFHGHNVSYGQASNGRFVYRFQSGNTGCDLGWFSCYQDEYNHANLNQYCGGNVRPNMQIVRFGRR